MLDYLTYEYMIDLIYIGNSYNGNSFNQTIVWLNKEAIYFPSYSEALNLWKKVIFSPDKIYFINRQRFNVLINVSISSICFASFLYFNLYYLLFWGGVYLLFGFSIADWSSFGVDGLDRWTPAPAVPAPPANPIAPPPPAPPFFIRRGGG